MTRQGIMQFASTARAIFAIKKHVEASDTFSEAEAALEQDGFDAATLASTLHPAADADLHLHSNHSDGNLPPKRIVWVARLLRLKAIAVTDHDSVTAVAEAVRTGRLLGIEAVPACELSTNRPGCEILIYMPDADACVDFLKSPASAFLCDDLARFQEATHRRTLAIIENVNAFLHHNGTQRDGLITVEELSDWFSGTEPFYYGTLAVLGLKRLSPEKRQELDIHDPRRFNTRVLQPALKKLPEDGPSRSTADALDIARRIRDAGVGVVSILAHPRELETKGGLSRAEAARFIAQLAEAGIDGIEVACSRDTAADIAHWNEVADFIDRDRTIPLIRSSFSSDFHVLNPGKEHGEITLGYGLLDEDHPAGNLRPQGSIEQLLAKLRETAARHSTS